MNKRESYTENDNDYLMAVVIEIFDDTPQDVAYAALLELHARLLQTQPYWQTFGEKHRFAYLRPLCWVKQALEREDWASACYLLGDVLEYGRALHREKPYADAAVMINVKAVLEECVYGK